RRGACAGDDAHRRRARAARGAEGGARGAAARLDADPGRRLSRFRTRLLSEYHPRMPIGRSLLLAAAKSDALNKFATTSTVVRRATRAFMPGETMQDGLDAGARIAATGRRPLYTRLGEALSDIREADAVRDHYLGLFDAIKQSGLDAEVSVKPTQLGFDQSLEKCREHCLTLARK